MKNKPYKARSIKGAERRVRELESQLLQWRKFCDEIAKERDLLARLAAEGPAFDNPLVVYEAKKIRDMILARMNMNPDGSYKAVPA